jgi:hypothetical protein
LALVEPTWCGASLGQVRAVTLGPLAPVP